MKHLVFVYGTLKRGFPNHGFMTGAEYLGTGRTSQAYPLVLQGPYHSPAMLPEPSCGLPVAGELWRVDDAQLAELDRLESVHLADGYTRETITVESTDASDALTAWVYFKPRDRTKIIHTESMPEYLDYSQFIPLERRGPRPRTAKRPGEPDVEL